MENVKKAVYQFGLPRVIILAFFFVLAVLAAAYGMDIPVLLGDVLRRWGMWGVLVLAMVPTIQAGVGPNFGITIGIVGGLLGALISVELRFYGFYEPLAANPSLDAAVSAMVAIVLAIFFASLFGFLYGLLLNQVKGSEMMVSTYVGLSIVALFNILWLVLPFKSGTSIWPIGGSGLRNQISLAQDFSGAFNNLWSFNIGGMAVPTGLLLMFFIFSFAIWLFTRSRLGMMMSAAGANPSYARANGINVNKMRVIGVTISTALGGVGIILYSQSFGFLQLYNAPQMMGFSCVASVLIGGASVTRARIVNVLLGAFLFHGIITVALPVANLIIPEGVLSEILRMIISNGIILYALSKVRGTAK